MKFSHVLLLAAFAGDALASWGFGRSAAYNRWHETELERWLSDHDIPYPKPATRKDLERIVQESWQGRVVEPYRNWDAFQLQRYLTEADQSDWHQSGGTNKKTVNSDKNWLVQQVQSAWHETERSADAAFGSVKDWIFDSWSDSQLKAFLDRHAIPNPSPRTRDSLLAAAHDSYQAVADKLGENYAYPGNWLYESWSESDLKRWLDERGYPAPQPATRDRLIAAVRRNSRLASTKAARAKDSAANAVSDAVFDSWSDSKLKAFLDKNNVAVPQGSTKNELLALARRNKAYLRGDRAYDSLTRGAAAAGDKAAQATDAPAHYAHTAFDAAIDNWSNSRLKAYLDSRGVPVPQASRRDELLAKVRLNRHKAATGFGAWTFDTWTSDHLRDWLQARGHRLSSDATASRDQLYSSASAYYSSMAASAAAASASAASHATDAAASAASHATDAAASAASRATDAAGSAASQATDSAASAASAGARVVLDKSQQAYASLSSALAQAAASVKQEAGFDGWSDSELKAYLDTCGSASHQGLTRNELVALARRNAHYFAHGCSDVDMGVWARLRAAAGYLQDTASSWLGLGGREAQHRAAESAQRATDTARQSASHAKHRAQEEL